MDDENNNLQSSNSILEKSYIKIKNLLNKNSQIVKISNSESNLFFIASFHNEIWEKAKIYFYIKDIQIDKHITVEYSYKSKKNPNHESKIFCIYFPKNIKRPKSIKLSISLWTFMSFNINELNNIDNNNKYLKFIFNDITFINREIPNYI